MTDSAAASREEIAPLGPNEARLYVNNLPWSLTDADLASWIQTEIGVTPIEVSIVQNKKFQRSRGYGFIKVNKNDLQKALTLNGKKINDRDIGVQEAQQRTDDERAAHREQQATKRAERRRDAEKSAQAAAPESSASASPSEPKRERAPRVKPVIKQFDNATTIHITNLAFAVDEAALTAYVQAAIGVAPLNVSIPTRKGKFRTGQSLGYGFVTVSNDKADAALALNGQTWEERELKVNISHPQTEEDGQGGNAQDRQQRPPRRNARRNGRGPRTDANGAAASPSDAAASPEAGAEAAAPGAKRSRARGRRAPRAGAEDGEAQ